MKVRAQVFWAAKDGNSDDEYEDAYAPDDRLSERPVILAGNPLRFAVADGATEASFSRLWARLLVKGYCESRSRVWSSQAGFRALQHEWAADVNARALAWYAEEKARLGAHSTLLGVSLIGPRPARAKGQLRRAEIRAVGDTCAFHIRGSRCGPKVHAVFPLQRSDEFTNSPALLSSVAPLRAIPPRLRTEWRLRRGDNLYLMTDALACWCLDQCEKAHAPWDDIRARLKDADRPAFVDWIAHLRSQCGLKNDDVTLLAIQT